MHDNQIIFLARARGPLVHSRQASEQHRSGTGRAQQLTSGCAVLGCCTRSAPRSFVGAPELPNERRAAVRGAPRHSLLCCDFSRPITPSLYRSSFLQFLSNSTNCHDIMEIKHSFSQKWRFPKVGLSPKAGSKCRKHDVFSYNVVGALPIAPAPPPPGADGQGPVNIPADARAIPASTVDGRVLPRANSRRVPTPAPCLSNQRACHPARSTSPHAHAARTRRSRMTHAHARTWQPRRSRPLRSRCRRCQRGITRTCTEKKRWAHA